MIGQAKSVSHGVNLICYISGEAANKKHPENIHHVEDRFLPSGLDAQGIYDMMRQRCKLKNNVIRIELSPAEEYTRNFTMDDWRELWHDFLEEFDKQELKDKKGKIYSYKTNLANSRSTCWLHLDSESGIPHLHAAVCRYDEDGRSNNDHGIHVRVQRAAEAIALERGWTTAKQKHDVNIARVNEDITNVLKQMPKWSWNDFESRLVAMGYWVHTNPDSQGKIHGYSIAKGNTRYKATQLGVGRNFMYSKLESTWGKMHQLDVEEQTRPVEIKSKETVADRLAKYSEWQYNATRHEITVDGNKHTVFLPQELENVLQKEVDYRSYREWDDIQNLALIFFFGGLPTGGAATSGGGGGGSSSSDGWRDKKDEDELERMRHSSRAAISHHGSQKKTKGRTK
jgi:hypothetical protein